MNVCDNLNQGKSVGKILWDLGVDLVGVGVGIAAGAASAAVVSYVGTAVAGACLIGVMLDFIAGETIDALEGVVKSWVD